MYTDKGVRSLPNLREEKMKYSSPSKERYKMKDNSQRKLKTILVGKSISVSSLKYIDEK